MLTVVPNYYTAFRCIGGRCRHNCCIGWEIGIDEQALDRYRARPDWNERFAPHITADACFITDDNGRCPFLNAENLCDIQACDGEHALCEICREHPRFHNALPDRTESGLGLCCEEAARLILGQTEPMTLCADGETDTTDEIVRWRDEALRLLQDRTRTVSERITALETAFGAAMPPVSPAEWARVLLSLERLDESWSVWLTRLRDGWQTADTAGFDAYMTARQTEFEQLLVYFVYRHAANAVDQDTFVARLRVAVLGYTVIRALGAVEWTHNGCFSFGQHCDIARAFSAEIEYSDENFDILLNILGGT